MLISNGLIDNYCYTSLLAIIAPGAVTSADTGNNPIDVQISPQLTGSELFEMQEKFTGLISTDSENR